MTTAMLAPANGRSGEWMADPGFGVYVHIPFCAHRCHYCDFNTYEGQEQIHGPYVDALIAGIERFAPELEWPEATSVFFGGGTPTLLTPTTLGRILRAIRCRIGIAGLAEITVEANPETVDEAAFAALLDAGFNRVSIGVQSLVSHVLSGLGRTHSAARAVDALRAARRAGIADLNADLIYGSPWETDADWSSSLTGILEAEPDHVSCYALTVEEATPLATLVRTGRVADVDQDVQAERHAVAEEFLAASGYRRYEISNWARPDRASRHNILYWSAGNYLGFGAGAHGHLDGRRYWNVRLPREFIVRSRNGGDVEDGFEILEPSQRAGEALMLGLRLTSGIDFNDYAQRFGKAALDERASAINALTDRGLLERIENRLRLAPRATMLANDVCSQVL